MSDNVQLRDDIGEDGEGNEDHDCNDKESSEEIVGLRMQEDSDSDDSSSEVIPFRVDQAFSGKDSIKKAIEKYAVDMKRNIRYKRSESIKVHAVCAEMGCPWNLYASINSSSKDMVVRTFVGKHKCSWNGKVQLLTSRKIADKFINEFRTNPDLKAGEIRNRLRTNDRLLMSKDKCRETRRICIKTIADEYEEQFRRMYDYAGALKESNPGSTIILGTKANVFEKFYSCFFAMKEGWKNGCRRILHLDGTFMKGKIKGEVLTAISRDANDKMFPVAWAIVPIENKIYWGWFMTLLQEDLDLGSGNGLTIVSDQQKGLIAARDSVLPDCEHRMCARHIWANLYKNFGDESGLLHIAFWKMAKAYNMRVFEQRVEDFKILNHEAYENLMRWSACHWSRAHFTGYAKCLAVENNMSESFNNVINDGRFKPLVGLLEDIRIHVMTSNEGKIRMIDEYNGELTPEIVKLLDKQRKKVPDCTPICAGRGWYEVDHGREKYRVNVRNDASCTCRLYEVSGIPCSHMVSALLDDSRNVRTPESLVSKWFSTTKWKVCYQHILKPINGMELWPMSRDVRVLPPPFREPRGRKKIPKRRLEAHEISDGKQTRRRIQMTCSKCLKTGHNKKTCPNEIAVIPPKKPRGRPSKKQSNEEPSIEMTPTFQSQPTPTFQSQPIPMFQSQPNVPAESHGVFHSPLTGDDYLCFGRSVRDLRTNFVLPSSLFREHERNKLNIRRRTIQVSVLGLIDVHTSSPSSSNISIKVSMGKLEYRTSDSGDYIFPVTRLRENLIVTLLDVNGNQILHKEIETRMIIENGFLEEKLSFNGYGNVQLKMQFVLSEEDRNRIRFLRQSALRKKHEELVNGSSFTKSKSIASDLSSLSSMQTRDIVAVANNPKTNLGLSQETELKNNADRGPVSSNLIMWKPEVKDTVEKTKIEPSSSDVSSNKKLQEVKEPGSVSSVKQENKGLSEPSKKLTEFENPESILLVKLEDKGLSKPSKKLTEAKPPECVSSVKQEDTGLSKPERIPKRKSMRRSMSDTSLNNVRKMISNFEVKVTQDTKIRTAKIQTGSCKNEEEKTKAKPQAESTVNIEKPEESKITSFENMEKSVCRDNTDRGDDLVIVSRDERTVVIEEKSLEQSTRRSDLLSTQRRSSVVEVRDVEKKPNKSVCLKDSQLENARGSRLWIFPAEAKDLSCETDLGTRHLDLVEANMLQKRIEESTREDIGERGFRCINIAKIDSNNKWKNIERSKKQKSENSAESESSGRPVGQVMRALIVAGFAGLVFLTRQRT
ncbi:Zinc finger SWIM-type [Arabidopsis thaliana x Arabidopsis arenosa]|uniref:Zinc finger SWIM-type n=1 Tax=Arabidopsis thaliana x Arabidopsis arenosa TaxID=1240361 RepID=A0A8T1XJ49_9BRAS|nr:Zinc finger SWIM-type [Arabidopsis thaliana x Arabidopsis arenosa]